MYPMVLPSAAMPTLRFVDYSTGSNTPRGNHSDIGCDNARQRKRWFSCQYFASVMNIREFFADNLGKDMADTISNALTSDISRRFAT